MVPDRGHGGHWRYVAAAIGCLILSATAFSAEAPYPAGTASPSPAIESQGDREKDASQERAADFALPVRIIEDPADAESARDREQRAEDHEAKDLEAQREAARAATRSADAAEDSIWPTKAQLGLATIGTALLFVSLGLTWAALSVTRNTAKRQLRAYVGIAKGQLKMIEINGPIRAILHSKNAGQTPAYKARIWHNIEVLERDKTLIKKFASMPISGASIILPGTELIHPLIALRTIDEDDRLYLMNDNARIYIYGEITYDDIFGEPHFTRFCMRSGNCDDGTFFDLEFCEEGNEAD